MPTISLPHLFQPRQYQLPLLKALDSGIKRAVVVWNRRSGKDKTTWNYSIKEAFQRVGAYYYFAPTYSQGKKIIWDGIDADGLKFLDHIPKELIVGKPNDTEMKIKLKNGSLIQIVGTDNIDSILGTNPLGCVFTEYSLQNPQAWNYIRPILAQNNGWAVFIFTPRGMNHGWKILQQALQDPQNWFSEILTVDDTKSISLEVLAQEKKEMPAELYEQEYYCKFLEAAGAFYKRIDENLWSGELEPQAGHTYQLGVDLAKYQDWTVITPFDLNTFKVGKQERFNQIDWNLQKAKIEALARKYNNAKIIIDSTGVGDPIAEDLMRQELSVEPFKFTALSKRQLLDNSSLLLAQDKIKIPDDEGLINELRSMAFTLTEKGLIKVEVPEGLTDDRIMSFALAVWGVVAPHEPKIKTEDYQIYNQDYS